MSKAKTPDEMVSSGVFVCRGGYYPPALIHKKDYIM